MHDSALTHTTGYCVAVYWAIWCHCIMYKPFTPLVDFYQSFESAAFPLQTSELTEHNPKPPQNHFIRQTECQQWMATRGSYVRIKPIVKFSGPPPPPPNFSLVFCKLFKILMVSNKTIHKTFRINKTLIRQNPLRKGKALFSLFTKIIYLGSKVQIYIVVSWRNTQKKKQASKQNM